MLCLNYGFPNVVKYFMPWRYFREQSQTHFFLLMNSKYSNLCTRQISFNILCSTTKCTVFSSLSIKLTTTLLPSGDRDRARLTETSFELLLWC